MSSIPGYTLEALLEELLNVDGNIPPNVVKLFEPYREQAEHVLDCFDEDSQSWRGYMGNSFDFISESLLETARNMLRGTDVHL